MHNRTTLPLDDNYYFNKTVVIAFLAASSFRSEKTLQKRVALTVNLYETRSIFSVDRSSYSSNTVVAIWAFLPRDDVILTLPGRQHINPQLFQNKEPNRS